MTAARLALTGLKASQLKFAAASVGLATTGTKLELSTALQHSLEECRSPFSRPPRVVSIDMGIKNLGICVFEAPGLFNGSGPSGHELHSLDVLRWERVDVIGQLESGLQSTGLLDGPQAERTSSAINASVFQPANMARMAAQISRGLLHDYSPSHILIERQRFRSGGASAVQEWTLRVNTLESMLWACFETLRRSHVENKPRTDGFPDILEISPARVARFWCGPTSKLGTRLNLNTLESAAREQPSAMSGRTVIDKKQKINAARSLMGDKGCDARMRLLFKNDTEVVANDFRDSHHGRKSQRPQSSSRSSSGMTKLDDLADCLLQGAAWVCWERNKRTLRDLLGCG